MTRPSLKFSDYLLFAFPWNRQKYFFSIKFNGYLHLQRRGLLKLIFNIVKHFRLYLKGKVLTLVGVAPQNALLTYIKWRIYKMKLIGKSMHTS